MNFTIAKLTTAVAFASIVPMAQAPVYSSTILNGSSQSNRQPYVYSTYQFPQTKATDVKHTLRLYIPESSEKLVKLSIAIPKGLTVKNDIRIEDGNGRLLPTASEIKNGMVTIDFPTPLVGANNINVNLNQVNLWGLNRNYQLTATYQGRVSNQQAAIQDIYVDSRTNTYSRNLGSVEFRRF